MGLFGNGKKPQKRGYRPYDPERERRKAEARKTKFEVDSFIELAKANPEIKQQLVLKTYGLEIVAPDPIKEQEAEIKKAITKEALDEIKKDPELRSRLAKQTAENIVGSIGRVEYEDDEPHDGHLGNTIQTLRQVRELKEELGVEESDNHKGGFFDTFKDPEVMREILKLIVPLVSPKGAMPPSNGEPKVAVRIDGNDMLIPESQYHAMLQQGRIKPVQSLETVQAPRLPASSVPPVNIAPSLSRPINMVPSPPPSPAPVPPPTPPKEINPPRDFEPPKAVDKIESPNTIQPMDPAPPRVSDEETGTPLPAFFEFVDLDTLAGYLSMDPSEFVDQLESGSLEGVPSMSILHEYLCNSTVDSVTGMIAPYRDNSKVGRYVQQLMTPEGSHWLNEVIKILKTPVDQRDVVI